MHHVGDEASYWDGGYCSLPCFETSDCGAAAVCILPVDVIGPTIHGFCYKACAHASDCRAGYACSAWDFTLLGSVEKTRPVCILPGAKPPTGEGQPLPGLGILQASPRAEASETDAGTPD
jgi:hypothetical protein